MFKRCLAIVLLLMITASSFQRYFVYAGFELNKNFIAKNLCVNRSRPWMHCNGRCYFMRKLKAAQDNEKKQAEKDYQSRLEVSFCQQPQLVSISSPLTGNILPGGLPVYQSFYTYSFSALLLQPPRHIA